MSAILPTALWDWAMRKVGYLTPAGLDLSSPSVPSTGVPVAAPPPAPVAAPPKPTAARAGAN